jgi:hypothetical protein
MGANDAIGVAIIGSGKLLEKPRLVEDEKKNKKTKLTVHQASS